MDNTRVYDWFKQWGKIDWVVFGINVLFDALIVCGLSFIFYPSSPVWSWIAASILVIFAQAAGYARIWKPQKVTKEDLFVSIGLFIFGAILFFVDLHHFNEKSFGNLGYFGSIGLLTMYSGIWCLIRVFVYKMSGKLSVISE